MRLGQKVRKTCQGNFKYIALLVLYLLQIDYLNDLLLQILFCLVQKDLQ